MLIFRSNEFPSAFLAILVGVEGEYGRGEDVAYLGGRRRLAGQMMRENGWNCNMRNKGDGKGRRTARNKAWREILPSTEKRENSECERRRVC